MNARQRRKERRELERLFGREGESLTAAGVRAARSILARWNHNRHDGKPMSRKGLRIRVWNRIAMLRMEEEEALARIGGGA